VLHYPIGILPTAVSAVIEYRRRLAVALFSWLSVMGAI
jgi:hypothetical protein